MTGWDMLWVIWFVYFVAVEGAALVNTAKGDTLSEHFWRYLRVGKSLGSVGRYVWFLRVATLVFGAWLVTHICFGWFGGGMFPRLW